MTVDKQARDIARQAWIKAANESLESGIILSSDEELDIILIAYEEAKVKPKAINGRYRGHKTVQRVK
jgi:hypothetical protein